MSISFNDFIVASAHNTNGSLPALVEVDFDRMPIDFENESSPLYLTKESETHFSNYYDENHNKHSFNLNKHSKIKNLFHFHSWAPVYYNPIDIVGCDFSMYPGATLISQNLTSTLVSSIGYSYNQTHGFHAHTEWMGWYPKISVGVDYGNEYATYFGGPSPPLITGKRTDPNINLSIRTRLPFRFSSGNTLAEINFAARYNLTNSWVWNLKDLEYTNYYSTLEPYITIYAARRMAYRDLRPSLGTFLYAGRLISINQQRILGPSSVVRVGIYLPGFSANQSLLVIGQWEKQELMQYSRPPRLQFTRGYENFPIESIRMLSADYAFPIVNVDLPFGPIVYFKRFIGNVFSDNGWASAIIAQDGQIQIQEKNLNSAGLDLSADMHFFRTPYEFRIGYRLGINFDKNNLFHDVIFSFNLASLYGYLPNNEFYNIKLFD